MFSLTSSLIWYHIRSWAFCIFLNRFQHTSFWLSMRIWLRYSVCSTLLSAECIVTIFVINLCFFWLPFNCCSFCYLYQSSYQACGVLRSCRLLLSFFLWIFFIILLAHSSRTKKSLFFFAWEDTNSCEYTVLKRSIKF